jgi:hypothetical protein
MRWPTFCLFGREIGGVTGWAQETRDLPRETAPYDEMKTERLASCGRALQRCSTAELQT